MNDQQRRDLADLRQVADARNHEQAQFLIKRLLSGLEYYYALALVLERANAFIDIFESYYPEEEWVRKLLLSIASFGTAPDDSIAEAALSQSFTAPGTGNYIKVIYDITQAMQPKHTPEARTGYMTSALVNSVMAELVEAWYGERPDAWETVRQSQLDPTTGAYDNPQATEIAYAFWTDEQTATLDRANWHEIADMIERTYARQQPV